MSDSLQILAADGTLVGERPALNDSVLHDLFEHMLRVRCLDCLLYTSDAADE